VGVGYQLQRSSILEDRDAICPSGEGCSGQDQLEIDRLTEDARGAASMSVVGFVAGGVLAAGGLTVLMIPHIRGTASAGQRTRVEPRVGLGYQGVTATHLW
jgi:hypothetical protein